MTVSVGSFKRLYPEFRDTSYDLVAQKLIEAERLVNPDVFGAGVDDAIMLKLAHLIAMSPEGEHARLKPGETMYEKEFNARARRAGAGYKRVI